MAGGGRVDRCIDDVNDGCMGDSIPSLDISREELNLFCEVSK